MSSAADFDADNITHAQALVYIRLHNALLTYLNTILRITGSDDVPYCAWLARNVLELHIWVEYCLLSPDKAKEFRDDAIRDVIDLNKSGGLGTVSQERLDQLTAKIPVLRKRNKYKDVKDAAEESGLLAHYHGWYKLLSKFAHPTAMTIIAPITGMGKQFLENAKVEAEEAIAKLDSSRLEKAYQGYRASIEQANLSLRPEQQLVLLK